MAKWSITLCPTCILCRHPSTSPCIYWSLQLSSTMSLFSYSLLISWVRGRLYMQTALMFALPALSAWCTAFSDCDVLVFELAKWCAKNGYVLGSCGGSKYLGLPRLPNWIVPSDMADLHNLVVSFTASHSPGDEWHPQKIIFLLGCNKSYVKCSTAYIAMAEMW